MATCAIFIRALRGTIASTLRPSAKTGPGENGDVKRVLVKFSTLTNWEIPEL